MTIINSTKGMKTASDDESDIGMNCHDTNFNPAHRTERMRGQRNGTQTYKRLRPIHHDDIHKKLKQDSGIDRGRCYEYDSDAEQRGRYQFCYDIDAFEDVHPNDKHSDMKTLAQLAQEYQIGLDGDAYKFDVDSNDFEIQSYEKGGSPLQDSSVRRLDLEMEEVLHHLMEGLREMQRLDGSDSVDDELIRKEAVKLFIDFKRKCTFQNTKKEATFQLLQLIKGAKMSPLDTVDMMASLGCETWSAYPSALSYYGYDVVEKDIGQGPARVVENKWHNHPHGGNEWYLPKHNAERRDLRYGLVDDFDKNGNKLHSDD